MWAGRQREQIKRKMNGEKKGLSVAIGCMVRITTDEEEVLALLYHFSEREMVRMVQMGHKTNTWQDDIRFAKIRPKKE